MYSADLVGECELFASCRSHFQQEGEGFLSCLLVWVTESSSSTEPGAVVSFLGGRQSHGILAFLNSLALFHI